MIPHVEIVIASLPKVLSIANQASRYTLLQGLDRLCERLPLRFADQQVHVLRHHYISVDAKGETAPYALQRGLENSPRRGRSEQGLTAVTGERYKVGLSGFVKSFQSPRHEASLAARTAPLKPKKGLNGPPAQVPRPYSGSDSNSTL